MNQYPPPGWDDQTGRPDGDPPTSRFAPVSPPHQGFGPPPPNGYGAPPRQGMSAPAIVAATLLAVVVVAALVAAAFFLTPRFIGGTSDAAATSTVSVTATVGSEPGDPTESGGADRSDGNSVPTVSPASPAPAGRPAGAYECWGGPGRYDSVAVGSSVTSCEFASSVWGEYIGAGGSGQAKTVTAYSPVTGTSYSMSCSGGAVVTCTGGNNAVVHIY